MSLKRFRPSQNYINMLCDINGDHELLSALYDINLLPETVSDRRSRSTRHNLIAFCMGYKLGREKAAQ